MSSKTIKTMKSFKFILLAIIFSAALSGCGGFLASKSLPANPVALSILAVGDIMSHTPQHSSAMQKDGSYNFDENYQFVKPIIEQADIAICNIEFTFAGKPYSGYPRFSAPEEIATAVKNAGFDVAVSANNHSFDNGVQGLKRTINILSSAGLKTTGTFLSSEDKKYILIEQKGIKIALIAATYESGVREGSITINGLALDANSANLINTFDPQNLNAGFEKYKTYIKQAKSDGADIIICYFHWGTEYKTRVDESQREAAKKLAAYGADIIFGSHPHTVQTFEIIKLKGRQVPVFYSLGNFISNQRQEVMGHSLSENAIIGQVNLIYDLANKNIEEISAAYTPAWVDKYFKTERYIYQIAPLTADFQKLPPISISGHKTKAEHALQEITEIIKD